MVMTGMLDVRQTDSCCRDETVLVKALGKFVSGVVFGITIEWPQSIWHPLEVGVFCIGTEHHYGLDNRRILGTQFITRFGHTL
jgi:hypothetical protein